MEDEPASPAASVASTGPCTGIPTGPANSAQRRGSRRDPGGDAGNGGVSGLALSGWSQAEDARSDEEKSGVPLTPRIGRR